jgi:hypothetical protein
MSTELRWTQSRIHRTFFASKVATLWGRWRTDILLNLACVLLWALVLPPALFAAGTTTSQGGNQYSPTFSPGFLIAWLICNGRKRKPIGGWLFFFYWQVYSGLLLSGVFFAVNIQSYVPENFENLRTFGLFLASAVPGLVLYVVKTAVATLLLSARTWDMLKLLRWVMVVEFGAAVLAGVLDAAYFPDNLGLSFLTIVPDALWLAYIFRSARVKHVFQLQDWDAAVNVIHPLKLKMAT